MVDDENFNENNSDDEKEEYDDEEIPDIDEYGHQIDGIVDVSNKIIDTKNDEDETQFDLNTSDNYRDFYEVFNNSKRKKKSNFPKFTKYEYSKLYGTLAQYIMFSNIKVPEEMKETYEVRTGDEFIIARYWIKNRKKYPLPTNLLRVLYLNVSETINPSNLYDEDDLSFKDDNDDTDRFYYNFRSSPYKKDLPIEDII